MEQPLSAALAAAVAANRPRLNAIFNAARSEQPRLGNDDAMEFLRQDLAPVADAVAAAAPARLGATVERLFAFGLPLVAGRWLGPGARNATLRAGLIGVLAGLPRFTAEFGERFAASAINALYNLEQFPGARTAAWAEALVAIGNDCADFAQLLDCGRVLAWTRGLAHYRSGALALLERLPPQLAGRMLGLDGELSPAVRARLQADAWFFPAAPEPQTPRIAARIGGFRGFGGPFLRPPQVLAEDDRLLADDGESRFVIAADAFGATWQRRGPTLDVGRKQATAYLAGVGLAELDGASSSAQVGNTLAVALPWSHRIVCVALAPKAGRGAPR